MEKIKNYLIGLDSLGIDITLTHNSRRNVKTIFGSILTIGIVAFCIYVTVYFGSDIINRTKPISRFSREMRDKAEVTVAEFPLLIEFLSPTGSKIPGIEELVSLEGLLFDVGTSINLTRIYL